MPCVGYLLVTLLYVSFSVFLLASSYVIIYQSSHHFNCVSPLHCKNWHIRLQCRSSRCKALSIYWHHTLWYKNLKPKVSASYANRPQWLSESHLNLIYLSILTFAHFSCFTRIYNNHTFTLYHLTWELKKPCIISFIILHSIQPKINELIILLAWNPIQATT